MPLIRPPGLGILHTPNFTKFTTQSIRTPMSYSGSAVCTPSRAAIFAERQAGGNYIRGNGEFQNLLPNPLGFVFDLKNLAGYHTGYFGKWGLGMETGLPWYHGFDQYVGQLSTKIAHTVFPPNIYKYNASSNANVSSSELDTVLLNLPGNFRQDFDPGNCPMDPSSTCTYVNDVVRDSAFQFMEEKLLRNERFLCVWAPTYPHAAQYNLNDPHKLYQSAVKRISPNRVGTMTEVFVGHASQDEQHLDGDIGMLMNLMEKYPALDENTLIVFTSDNGAQDASVGYNYLVFETTGGLRGYKRQVFEGGIRVPTVVRWKNVIPAGGISITPFVGYDLGNTFREAAGLPLRYFPGPNGEPSGTASMLQQWKNPSQLSLAPKREWLHIEYCPGQTDDSCLLATTNISNFQNGGPVYKLLRLPILPKITSTFFRLYDLRADPLETTEITDKPLILSSMIALQNEIRSPYRGPVGLHKSKYNPNHNTRHRIKRKIKHRHRRKRKQG